MSDTNHIFISYPHTETDFAARLAADLKNKGVRIWMDVLEGGIRGGDDWRRAIEQGLDNSAAVISIICPDYLQSTYCRKELARADRLQRPIFPVYLRELMTASDWPIEIEGIQYTDFRDWRDEQIYQGQLNNMLGLLKRDAAAQVGTPPDAETQYLTSLIAELEGRKGVLEYVDLAGAMDEPVRPKPRLTDEWGLEGAFALLEQSDHSAPSGTNPELRERKTIPLNSIRQAVNEHKRFVLIGEPGAGKTTTLRRLALEAARTRLKNPKAAPLPILVYLPGWADGVRVADFMREQLVRAHLNISLESVVLYLDGLNEMGSTGADKAKLLREWLAGTHTPEQVIVTCRAGDYVGDLVLGLPTVLAQAMDEERVRQFVMNYLGDEAEKFLSRILPASTSSQTSNQEHSLFRLAANPYLLTALMVVYKSSPEGDLPRNNGALFRNLAIALWERERLRRTLGWIPFEQAEVVFGRLAFSMVERNKPVDVSIDYATQLIEDSKLLLIGQSSNLIEIRGNNVRFFHQLMQEYFASVILKLIGIESVLVPPRFGKLGRLAEIWDQPLLAFCGIVPNADNVIETISEVDPYLALQFISSGIDVSNGIFQKIIVLLVMRLGSRNQHVSYITESTLIILGRSIVPELLIALRNRNSYVRRGTANVLGIIGDKSVIPPLLEALQDKNADVRSYVANALQNIVKNEREFNYNQVFLNELISLFNALHDSEHSVSNFALETLIAMGSVSITGFLEILRRPGVYSDIRYRAAYALGAIGDSDAVAELLIAIESNDNITRRYIIGALGKIGDVQAVPKLLSLLRDKDLGVAGAAARALGKIGDKSVVPTLMNILSNVYYYGESYLRADAAAEALEKIGTLEALEAVRKWREEQQSK